MHDLYIIIRKFIFQYIEDKESVHFDAQIKENTSLNMVYFFLCIITAVIIMKEFKQTREEKDEEVV